MTSTEDPRPYYLHAVRPNGAHAWAGPYADGPTLIAWAAVIAPHVPLDATWDVTRNSRADG